MQYKILNIYEEDYGCEGVPEGQEPMCRVQIQDEKGTEQWISIADRVLREQNLQEGDFIEWKEGISCSIKWKHSVFIMPIQAGRF